MMVTVTEICSKLYIIEYIVVFCLNDILVITTEFAHVKHQYQSTRIRRYAASTLIKIKRSESERR